MKDSVTRFFASGSFHESVSPQPLSIHSKIRGTLNDSTVIIRGLGEGDSLKKPEAKNLVTLSL